VLDLTVERPLFFGKLAPFIHVNLFGEVLGDLLLESSEDERAYSRLSKAIKEKNTKDLTKLYKNAAEAPMEVCIMLNEALKRCKELSPYCRKSLASDLLEAEILLKAAFLSAKFNVEINLRSIKNKKTVSVLNRKLSRLQGGGKKRWPQL